MTKFVACFNKLSLGGVHTLKLSWNLMKPIVYIPVRRLYKGSYRGLYRGY